MKVDEILALIKEKNIQMVDFRLVDVPGRQHHVTVPAVEVDEDMLTRGVAFDGSSIQGFRHIEESDMVMRPDLSTAYVDAFTAVPTLDLVCGTVRSPKLDTCRFRRYCSDRYTNCCTTIAF